MAGLVFSSMSTLKTLQRCMARQSVWLFTTVIRTLHYQEMTSKWPCLTDMDSSCSQKGVNQKSNTMPPGCLPQTSQSRIRCRNSTPLSRATTTLAVIKDSTISSTMHITLQHTEEGGILRRATLSRIKMTRFL